MDSSKNIRLLFYLPNLRSYADRALLVESIAAGTQKSVLLTSLLDEDPKSLGLSKVQVVEVPKERSFWTPVFFRASKAAEILLKREKLNIIHDTFGHLLPLFRRRQFFPQARFLTSLYTLARWDFDHFLKPRYGWTGFFRYHDLRYCYFRLPLQKWISQASDRVILQAPGLIPRFTEQHPHLSSKMTWIPNAIAPSIWKAHNGAPLSSSHTKVLRLLFVGGLSLGKGGDLLLDLLSEARSQGVSMQCTCVGSPAKVDEAYLNRKIKALDLENQIYFIGKSDRNTLSEIYREHDWLFHVSSLDGSPRVVLEALAQGLPVIGSRHPGIKVFDPEEAFIFFTGPKELKSILEELRRTHHEPERHLERREKGRKAILSQFSVEKISSRYLHLYKEILSL